MGFHGGRGESGEGKVGDRGREQDGPAGMAQGQGAAHVFRLIDAFNRDSFGGVLLDDLGKAAKDGEEAGFERCLRRRTNRPEIDDAILSPRAQIDDTIAGRDKTRVDTEDDQSLDPRSRARWKYRSSSRRC